jgi:hypothetical protein
MADLIFTLIAQDPTPWFTNYGDVGGLLGAGVGVLGGGVYGPLVGTLAPRGAAKSLVLGYHFVLLALGIAVLAAGLVAMIAGQPRGVWISLMMPGGLLALLMTLFTPMILARYRQAEHRRLEAEEFRRT